MKIQPKVFLTEVFGNPLLMSWTSAPSGHGCPRQNACFSRILTTLTEVLGRDIRANDPPMSAGCPSQKLPLWADFSFLKKGLETRGLLDFQGRMWDRFRCTVEVLPGHIRFGSHLGTLALKTENFSKKIGRSSKTPKWIY